VGDLPPAHGVGPVGGVSRAGGVYEDHDTPNPRLRAWLGEWEHWRAEADDYLEIGDDAVVPVGIQVEQSDRVP
jgi:hypothetical protein